LEAAPKLLKISVLTMKAVVINGEGHISSWDVIDQGRTLMKISCSVHAKLVPRQSIVSLVSGTSN
jgi:hypothetical protein